MAVRKWAGFDEWFDHVSERHQGKCTRHGHYCTVLLDDDGIEEGMFCDCEFMELAPKYVRRYALQMARNK